MKLLLLLIAGLAFSPASEARAIYKCEHQGTILYSHWPCAPGDEPVELPTLGQLGSKEDARGVSRRLEALRKMDIPGRIPKPAASSDSRREGLSFGERITLRKLEMRADNLRRDLLNGRSDPDWRRLQNAEIRSLQKRIDELRARQ